jgi:hypothetical protein
MLRKDANSHQMITLRIALTIFVLSTFSAVSSPSQQTNLVPGLAIFKADGRLKGKLVFIAGKTPLNPPGNSASLFSFDLESFAVTRLTQTPNNSLLVVSDDGQTFAVPADMKAGEREYWKLFVYSAALKKEAFVTFSEPIRSFYLKSSRVFAELEEDGIEHLAEFDLGTMQQTNLYLPCGRMSGSRFGSFHESETDSNAIHFDFSRLRVGKPECESGLYSYDLATRQMAYVGSRCNKPSTILLAGGKYFGFEGEGGPITGTRLVSVNSDRYFWLARGSVKLDPAEFERKLVHNFGTFRGFFADNPILDQASPDRRFALVRSGKQVYTKSGGYGGTIYTYHIVNATNSHVQILCKNDLPVTPSGGWVSNIHWVP